MKKILCPFFLFYAVCLTAQIQPAGLLRQKCFVLHRFLQQQHYQPLSWTDSTVSLFFNRWLEQLDENKLYFTKEDVVQLAAYRSKLAGELQGGGQSFFDATVQLYRKRLLQSDTLIRQLLVKPIDVNKAAALHWPPTDFAGSAGWSARWQQVVQWKLLAQIADLAADSTGTLSLKLPPGFAGLEKKAREKLQKQHQALLQKKLPSGPAFEQGLQEDFLSTITACYDPHTNYMNLSVKKEFETALSGFEFTTGLDVTKNDRAEWMVDRLVPGGAAWRSGELHAGDVLLKIKVGNQPETALDELEEEQVHQLLQGSSDESLLLTIRQKSGVQKTITLVKEKITADEEVVKGFLLQKGDKKLGYIVLPDFYSQADDETEQLEGCANDVAKEVLKLKKEGIQGLVLDLRNNGGGSMWEALQLAGIFINEGVMGSFKGRDGKVHFMKDPNRGTIYDGPLLVLVNGGSASASEFLAAVLQDYHRALIVGGNTYGKGTAQVVLPLDTAALAAGQNSTATDFVKTTSGKFYRADGSTTQWKGVLPDIALPDLYLSDKLKEKGDAAALRPDAGKPGMYTPLAPLPVGPLIASSSRRVAADSSFIAVRRFAAWFTQNMQGETIPLHWTGFAAWTNEIQQLYMVWAAMEKGGKALLTAGNTAFDQQRINMQPQMNRQANAIRLANIASDIFIAEGVNILQDWLNLKN